MARPSGNTDQKLVEAALALFPKTGFSNLKVRDVAKRAGVNLGLFHYHFKNKDVFIERVMHDFYEAFFSRLQWDIADINDPLQRLRQAVLTMIKFVRDHRHFMIPLLNDILQGHQQVMAFLTANMQRHIRIVVQLIKTCQKTGRLAGLPLPTMMFFLIGPQVMPTMILNVMEKNRESLPLTLLKIMTLPKQLSDRAIEQRLDLALKAMQLGPHPGPRHKQSRHVRGRH